MGTRFLLTSDSPVPDVVKRLYLGADLTGTVVTTRVDGVPHRVLHTTMVDHLVRGGALASLVRSVRNAPAYRAAGGLSWGQVLMAANTPVLLRAAMVDGRTDLGLISSGQVTGLIDDLPSCVELIEGIMAEARATLDRLAGANQT